MKVEQSFKCSLCGEHAQLFNENYPGYQEPDKFNIYHCPNCNTSFSYPNVETKTIYENIYKNGRKVPGYDRYWKYAKIVKKVSKPLHFLIETESTYWAVKESLTLYVKDKQKTKILELGSGLGYLTYSLVKENYNIKGIDISQKAVNQACENFGNHYICADLFDYAQSNAESYDVVILTEVIEHITNPLAFIEAILKLLKSGGRVIITTPNKSLYPTEIIWATECPPVHCWWFSEESMKYIAKKMNLNLNLIDFSNFYKKNYKEVNIKLLLKNQLQIPIFNNNGNLIIQKISITNIIKLNIKLLLAKIPLLKKLYTRLKLLVKTENVVCKDNGITLCAVFQKQ